jgi:hypothetical protein
MIGHMGAGTVLAPRRSFPLPALIAVIGGAVAVAGSALPWVTIFGGTETLTGWDGAGRFLAGLAVASVAITILFLRSGRPRALRRLALLAGGGVLLGSALEIWWSASAAASHAVSARILDPSLGPGPFVMLAGALLLLTVSAIPTSPSRAAAGLWPRVLLAGALFTSGWIHIALTPEHLGEATVLGLGFLIFGLAELGLAGLIIVRPSDLALYAVIGLSVALVVLYAIAVVKGLPVGSGHDHDSGLILGSGEPIDAEGAISKLAELCSLVMAFVLVGRCSTSAASPPSRLSESC